ncbi:MAG: transglutaminase family protein [Clostridia bacterium]|nr:transglutaminase family protein [Clostridia bacterium]
MLIMNSNCSEDYLASSTYVNFDHKLIQDTAVQLAKSTNSEIDFIKAAFEFVRDKTPHSFDIGATKVSITASDVLVNGHGICYAKTLLLAAILRYMKIPAGFCYQKLQLSPENPKIIIHALNAVYIQSLDQWIRLDARGNKNGVDAQFSLTEEKLAFPVRPELGESDGFVIYSQPAENTISALKNSKTVSELVENLPEEL